MARERRLETLHSDRAAKDERIESAAADVFLGLNRRETAQAKAQAEINAAETSIGGAGVVDSMRITPQVGKLLDALRSVTPGRWEMRRRSGRLLSC